MNSKTKHLLGTERILLPFVFSILFRTWGSFRVFVLHFTLSMSSDPLSVVVCRTEHSNRTLVYTVCGILLFSTSGFTVVLHLSLSFDGGFLIVSSQVSLENGCL